MGCRSSEAEITGNSNARRQPERTNERACEYSSGFREDLAWRRQTTTAGNANNSHRILRSSSILLNGINHAVVEGIVTATCGKCRIEFAGLRGDCHYSMRFGVTNEVCSRFDDRQDALICRGGVLRPVQHYLIYTELARRPKLFLLIKSPDLPACKCRGDRLAARRKNTTWTIGPLLTERGSSRLPKFRSWHSPRLTSGRG